MFDSTTHQTPNNKATATENFIATEHYREFLESTITPLSHPLEGKEAFQKALELIRPLDGSTEIWLKLGSNIFVTGEFSPDGDFLIYATYKTGETADTRQIGAQLGPAYDIIRDWSENHDGGVFYIPTQPQGYPGKGAIAYSDDIAAELDSGTPDEQWEMIKEFVAITGLNPALIAHSGGKSYHPHWKGIEHFPIEQTIYLRQLLAIALDSDITITNPHQPMRKPGFFRREKGSEQKLFYYSTNRYTYDELIAGLKRYFEAKGLPWLDQISDQRWRNYFRNRTDLGRESAIAVLAKTEEEINPPRKARAPDKKAARWGDASFERAPLEIFLTRENQALIEEGIGSHRNNHGAKLARNTISENLNYSKGFS